MNYNNKDIFLQRATANQTFEEYALRMQPNGVVVSDAAGNLAVVPSTEASPTSSWALNAINAENAVSASYAANVPNTASYALQALNAVYALTSSYEATIEISSSWASASLTSISASWAPMPTVSNSSSWASSSVSASYANYADRALSASYAPDSGVAINAETASVAFTASSLTNGQSTVMPIADTVVVMTGYDHAFTFGDAGSTINLSKFPLSASSVIASLQGTADQAISASHADKSDLAISASWAPQPVIPTSVPSASWASSSISASYAANVPTTASYALIASTASALPSNTAIGGVSISTSGSDTYIAGAKVATIPVTYASQYLPALNSTYAKATTENAGDVVASNPFNPNNSLIGSYSGNQWQSDATGPNRLHADLGSAKVITHIYYENGHHFGGNTYKGARHFTFWGSNNAAAFSTLTYANDTNWTQLATDVSEFAQHSSSDAPDPKYVNVTNTTPYRYYAFKFADNWNWTTDFQTTVRRIELQTSAYSTAQITSSVAILASSASVATTASYAPAPSSVATASYAVVAAGLLELSQSIIPSVSNSFDLGSPSKPWQHLYVGPNSMYIGGIPVTTSGSQLYVSGSPIATTSTFTDNSVRIYLTASSTSSNSAPLKFSSGPLMLHSEAGAMEFYFDDYYASISTVATPSSYTSVYPPAHNSTFVKATTVNAGDVQAYFATNPALLLTGPYNNNQWQSTGQTTNRFHIDLGTASIVQRVYLENGHNSGTRTEYGTKDFTFWGSNNNVAFNDLTYGNDTNWTQLPTDITSLRAHVASDQGDPQYAVVTNNTPYRYYCFKIANSFAGGQVTLRRIELQVGNYIGGDRKVMVLTDGNKLPANGYVPITTTNGRLTASVALTLSSSVLNTTASRAISASYAPVATVGLTATQSWWDAITSTTQSMYVQNGLIVSWSFQP